MVADGLFRGVGGMTAWLRLTDARCLSSVRAPGPLDLGDLPPGARWSHWGHTESLRRCCSSLRRSFCSHEGGASRSALVVQRVEATRRLSGELVNERCLGVPLFTPKSKACGVCGGEHVCAHTGVHATQWLLVLGGDSGCSIPKLSLCPCFGPGEERGRPPVVPAAKAS